MRNKIKYKITKIKSEHRKTLGYVTELTWQESVGQTQVLCHQKAFWFAK